METKSPPAGATTIDRAVAMAGRSSEKSAAAMGQRLREVTIGVECSCWGYGDERFSRRARDGNGARGALLARSSEPPGRFRPPTPATPAPLRLPGVPELRHRFQASACVRRSRIADAFEVVGSAAWPRRVRASFRRRDQILASPMLRAAGSG